MISALTEDGKPQKILSFDANGFTPAMDYVPLDLPKQPANMFWNLPQAPEKGPLYVLLYDLVDMDDPGQVNTPEDYHIQMTARQQMIRFIESKPEGARFAIFVRSDGLHLVQGFTSDKAQLLAAIDPHHPRPHMPMVFLMGANFGRGNRLGALDTLHHIAAYLDGMPGRKNLIWFSGMFPLSLFAGETDGPSFREETKAMLDMLAHEQIAVYPVDARGVPSHDSHVFGGSPIHMAVTSGSQDTGAGSSSGGGSGTGSGGRPGGGASGVPAPGTNQAAAEQGNSDIVASYDVMDGIAKETGGRAFYGSNDVARELVSATQVGAVYYTLTYAPSDTEYRGALRSIHVNLDKKGYQLAYRRSYYGTALPDEAKDVTVAARETGPETAQRKVGDTLSANMKHGAPTAHALVLVVQAHMAGAPLLGTAEQMAELSTEPAYFKSRRRSRQAKPLPPVVLQKDVFDFDIPMRQFKGETALGLELAAAAYNANGEMMNAVVGVTRKDLGTASGGKGSEDQPRFFRAQQELEVPHGAATLRFAVRDTMNDRTGAMEIALPLEAEPVQATGSAAGSHF